MSSFQPIKRPSSTSLPSTPKPSHNIPIHSTPATTHSSPILSGTPSPKKPQQQPTKSIINHNNNNNSNTTNAPAKKHNTNSNTNKKNKKLLSNNLEQNSISPLKQQQQQQQQQPLQQQQYHQQQQQHQPLHNPHQLHLQLQPQQSIVSPISIHPSTSSTNLNGLTTNGGSSNNSSISSSTELFNDDKSFVEDITEWNSRTLLIHNIMPGMDDKVIRDILGTQFKYTFKPAGKPNQLYILFVSPKEAKHCFYSQLKGIRKIDNSGQSCIKICFNNEYKTVIRCTIPDPFPLNNLSPVLSSIAPLATGSPSSILPVATTAGSSSSMSTSTTTNTSNTLPPQSTTPIKSNLVATSSSFEPSNFNRRDSSGILLPPSTQAQIIQQSITNSPSMSHIGASGHINPLNGNSNSYFQFSNEHNNYYDHHQNIQMMNHELNIYQNHSSVPSPMSYSGSSQSQQTLPPFHLEGPYQPSESPFIPTHLLQQSSGSPIQSPMSQHHYHTLSQSSQGSSNNTIPQNSNTNVQIPVVGVNGHLTNGATNQSKHSKTINSKKYQYINELLKLTEENQVIVFPGNQLSTLPRVPTFVFDKLPMKFSYSQHVNYKEKKSTILTGFLREYEDKKKSVGLSQRSSTTDDYYSGNDYHHHHSNHHHGHHHHDSYSSGDHHHYADDDDDYPDEEFFREYPELIDKYDNYRVFYYTCYEKTTPTISLISNLSKSYLKERCGRLSVLLLTDWAPDNSFAIGTIQFFNGTPLDLSTISKCILVNHQVFHSDHFDKELVDIYEDWLPSEEEEARRVDLTHLVPVTIDPPSSTDLDDALSFRHLPDEKSDGQPVFEIGIHISDVSYFLEKSSKLDMEAEYRLNTIYLIGGNIPMLPKNLSSHTCSLKLYQKRFCFSQLIKIRADGTIIDKKYCKSFLRSQGHLSYEKAQRIINKYKSSYEELADFNNTEMRFIKGSNETLKTILEKHFSNADTTSTTTSSSPTIFNNNGTNDLESKVHLSIWGLYLVSTLLNNLRKEKKEIFDIGGNVQFDLSLDGVPYNIDFLPKLESHVLVQEFMHLANNLAAISLISKNSEFGILYSTINKPSGGGQEQSSFDNRKKFFDRLNVFIKKFNPSVTITSQDDWKSIKQKVDDSNQFCTVEQSKAMRRLAMHLMDPSKYITTQEKRQAYLDGTIDERAQYCHYSSPIRRYCDVNIHRALSLQLTEQVQWTKDCLIKPYWIEDSPEFKKFKASLPIGQQLEILCQKYNDISWKRKISEKLNLLYLTTYLWEQGPMPTPGVIIAMSTKHLVIYLVNFNLEVSSDKSEFLSISISKNDQYVIEEDDEDLFISKQLVVFVSVEPFTLFRNNLIPKIKISKYPPNTFK
ncbi:hypothetical protein DLAC_04499 [Tieghemostelium lacteum]|uniref:RNB domain-containing protein n=1 Tax=Tieghemostelium lacteum TaxID=361077 RepID=A0A151ZJW4_TIELA|nr:hypothetical protein DLAC_04499 [Tieghemostelium lacteum]|eukprot:KYQ94205.1 hypothetical protein DLAC_04499 [Tieghemostelium lacteum]